MSSAVQKQIYISLSWPCNQPSTGLICALSKPAGLCINMDQHTDINLKERAGQFKNTGMKGRLNRKVLIHLDQLYAFNFGA